LTNPFCGQLNGTGGSKRDSFACNKDQSVDRQTNAAFSEAESSVTTVKVYTRHNRGCSKREQSDWARCNCMKWLYIYRDGKYKLVSAKTRSWERAEQKAREVRDTFDPIRQLQRRLESQSSVDKSQIDIATAVDTMPLSNFFEGKQFRQFVVRSSTWVCTRRLVPILSSRLGQIAHFCNSFRTYVNCDYFL